MATFSSRKPELDIDVNSPENYKESPQLKNVSNIGAQERKEAKESWT
jgi:hypothetical protein